MSRQGRPDCPPEVLDWIAWYPEGDLPDAVRAAVESHAAECVACRREIDLVRGEAAEVEAALPDADALFARVLARLEQDAAAGRPTARPGHALAAPRRGRGATRAPRLAAGLALVLAVAGLGGWLAGRLAPDAVYETASAAPEGAAASGPRLQVVFRDDASGGRVAAALRRTGARVVAGPSTAGVFHLALPPDTDAQAAAARLRQEGVARFVAPIAAAPACPPAQAAETCR